MYTNIPAYKHGNARMLHHIFSASAVSYRLIFTPSLVHQCFVTATKLGVEVSALVSRVVTAFLSASTSFEASTKKYLSIICYPYIKVTSSNFLVRFPCFVTRDHRYWESINLSLCLYFLVISNAVSVDI